MGKGVPGDYSHDLHREFTSFAHPCTAVTKLQANLPTESADSVRRKEIIRAQLGDSDALFAREVRPLRVAANNLVRSEGKPSVSSISSPTTKVFTPSHYTADALLILGVVNPISRVSRRLGHPAHPGGLQGSWSRPFQTVDPTVDPKRASRRCWPQSFRAQTNLCLRK